MTQFVDLAPAADQLAALLPEISAEMLPAATPSADRTVEELLGHVIGLSVAFRAGAEKAPDNGPPPGRPPALPADWRTALPEHLDALVTAWREPASRDGVTSVGGVEMPASMVAVVALDELVLHGWDLARATGQPFRPEDASVEACLQFVAATASPDGVPGLFGPLVPVPADAPAFDRLLGLSGRNPGWSADPG